MVDPIHRLAISSVSHTAQSAPTTASSAVQGGASAEAANASPQAIFQQVAALVRQGTIRDVNELAHQVIEQLGQLRFAQLAPGTRQALIERMHESLSQDPLFCARMEQLWLASKASEL